MNITLPPLPEARWNFDASETSLLVCRDDHDKGEKCEYEELHPAEALRVIDTLRSRVLQLEADRAQRGEPVLWRYRDSEQCIKPMDGYTPGEGWTPLYAAPQPERKPMTRERRNVIINDAEKSALPTRQAAAYAIDETERYHGIKP